MPTSGSSWRSSTPATGRCRSARTCTCRGEHRAELRPRRRARIPAGHPVRHVTAIRTGRREAGGGGGPAGPSTGPRPADQAGLGTGAVAMVQISREEYAASVRADGRRPDPVGRHRSVDRGRAGPHRGRRGGRVRRRQVDPGVDGPGRHHPGRGGAGHGHHQRDRARPLGHRPGRRRNPGRPHRRARPRRQSRHRRRRAPATCRSARRPTSSPARARSSPRAASTPTCTCSRRRRWSRRWPPG